eukprot:m51a1_g10283 hypothetical protein (699) ;mRNA; r:85662-88605
MALAHRGKEKVKVEFDVHVRRVTNLKGRSGSTVFINWRRGTNANTGMTKSALVTAGEEAVFEEHVVFAGTLFRDAATGAYDEKKLSVALREVVPGKSKGRDVAKLHVNVSAYAARPGEVIQIPFEKSALSRASVPVLHAVFSHKPLQVGNQKLVKLGEGETKPGMIRQIDGETYVLEEASMLEDPTVDTMSVASDLETDLADDSGMLGEDSAAAASLRKELDAALQANHELRATVAAQEQTISELRQKLAETTAKSPLFALPDAQELRPRKHHKSKDLSPSDSPTNAPGSRKSLFLEIRSDSPLKTSSTNVGQLAPSTSFTNLSPAVPAGTETPGEGGDELTALRTANEEFLFIEREVYNAQIKFRGNNTQTAHVLFERITSSEALSSGNLEPFDRLILSIDNASQSCAGNLPRMCYWLSTVCGLALAVRKQQHRLESYESGGGDAEAEQEDSKAGRQNQTAALSHIDGRLTSLIFKIYSSVVAYMTSELRQYAVSVILLGDTYQESPPWKVTRAKRGVNGSTEFLTRPMGLALATLRESFVPDSVVQQIFSQVSYFISARVFNYIMSHKEDCVVDRGFQMKMELSKLRDWLVGNKLKAAADQLNVLQETATVFVMDKGHLTDQDTIKQVCPSLSLSQLRQIMSSFPETPSAALVKLKQLMGATKGAPAPDVGVNMDEAFMARLSYAFLDEKLPDSRW